MKPKSIIIFVMSIVVILCSSLFSEGDVADEQTTEAKSQVETDLFRASR